MPLFLDLVRDASDRYITASIVAWEFARGKLRGDPLYRCDGLRRAAAFGRNAGRHRLRQWADAGDSRRGRKRGTGRGAGLPRGIRRRSSTA